MVCERANQPNNSCVTGLGDPINIDFKAGDANEKLQFF
jgi:hypothetical protein